MKLKSKVTSTTLQIYAKKDKLSMTDASSLTNISECVGDPLNFIGISRHFYGLFQPRRLGNALLTAVAQGNQNKVERMPHLGLLLEKGNVTDYSGRQFKQITAYQYALWALDRRMVRAIEQMACKESGFEADNIRAALLKQRTELKEMGIIYTLDGATYCEAQYKYQTLIDSYSIFSESWAQLGYFISYQAWQNIAKLQKLMPAHVVQEMCNPKFSIDKIPTFKEQTQDRFSFYINPLNRYVNVFPWDKLTTQYLLVKNFNSPGLGRYLFENNLIGNTNTTLQGVDILWIATIQLSHKPNLTFRELFFQNGKALETLFSVRNDELKPEPELGVQASKCTLS